MGHERWEYLTLPAGERDRLVTLGGEGWELASIGGRSDEQLLYLKRVAPDLRQRVTLDQRRRYYESLGLDPYRQPEPADQ